MAAMDDTRPLIAPSATAHPAHRDAAGQSANAGGLAHLVERNLEQLLVEFAADPK
jgi:hypothetical protein